MTPVPVPRKALAIAALVAGMLSFCLPVLGSLAAVALGIAALVRKRQGGKGMAIAGIVPGVLMDAHHKNDPEFARPVSVKPLP